MKKPHKSYSESVNYNGENLLITINVFKDEPALKTPEQEFYTFIEITKDGQAWGRLFLPLPVKDSDFPQAIKDVTNNIEHYKYESNKKQYSQN
jgi:hypothetical protein